MTALAVAAIALAGMAVAQEAPSCNGFSTPLFSSAGAQTGVVNVELVSPSVLRVTYVASDPWLFTESQFAVTKSPTDFPTNDLGCPLPCRFAFSKVHNAPTATHSYQVNINDVAPGSTLYLAARVLSSPIPGATPQVCKVKPSSEGRCARADHHHGDCGDSEKDGRNDRGESDSDRSHGRDSDDGKNCSRSQSGSGSDRDSHGDCDKNHGDSHGDSRGDCDKDHGPGGPPVPCDASQRTEGTCSCEKPSHGGDSGTHDGDDDHDGHRCSRSGYERASKPQVDDRCDKYRADSDRAEAEHADAEKEAQGKSKALRDAKADLDNASAEKSAAEKELGRARTASQKKSGEARLSRANDGSSRAKKAYDHASAESARCERDVKDKAESARKAREDRDRAVSACSDHGSSGGHDSEHHSGDGDDDACSQTAWGLGTPFSCTIGAMFFACKTPNWAPE